MLWLQIIVILCHSDKYYLANYNVIARSTNRYPIYSWSLFDLNFSDVSWFFFSLLFFLNSKLLLSCQIYIILRIHCPFRTVMDPIFSAIPGKKYNVHILNQDHSSSEYLTELVIRFEKNLPKFFLANSFLLNVYTHTSKE